ncbi:MAG: LPS-assembly protein LptD [Beijerinckiaceae bacterium]
MAAILTAMVQATPSHAQTLNDRLAQRANQSKSRLAVEAREIVYDNDNERVEARGDVQLYYDNRVLEADRVIYDRKTKRVFAEGNARLKEPNGQVLYSERFELTDDFRDGFIDSLRVVSADNQRISAARGERTDGETTVFEKGTYTACLPCKDNPERPPLWQVKAARIIAKNSEQMIYYEDARIEFFGVPLAYIPFFSAPDPTVSRKSGFLAPRYVRRASLGYGVQLPFYWAPAPHYDVLYTFSPYTRQGILNQVEWRHRLETGVYNIRAAGIWQSDPKAFLPGPFGPNRPTFGPLSAVGGALSLTNYPADLRRFRGSIETTGKFLLNDKWTFGWDIALQTDRYFFTNYRVKSESIQTNYFRESISNVYLQGKSDKAFFDLNGYYFQTLSALDLQKQIPVVHPVLDYNRRFQPEGIGGELSFDLNATMLSREAADYVGLPPANQRYAYTNKTPWGPGLTRFIANNNPLYTYLLGAQAVNLGYGCGPTDPLSPNPLLSRNNYTRANCLLRGIAGSSSRVSAVLSWRRSFIDPIGQVWTPFASAQVDVLSHSLSTGNIAGDPYRVFGDQIYGNDKQTNFISNSDTSFRAMPAIGVEYRFPLIASSSFGSHLFEPIAQIVVRPNEQRIGRNPNEDSQSLVFSDANIFQLNKFSGYDRVEGGVRANVGAQYTLNFTSGGYLNALVGQSYHLRGRNSFAVYDQVNTGANSGLDKQRSDYVGRITFAPTQSISFTARGRFDEETLKLRRLEVSGALVSGPLSATVLYARQDAQPELGFVRRREGIAIGGRMQLPNNWFVNGSVLLDLDRYLLDRDVVVNAQIAGNPNVFKYNSSPFRPASVGLGFGYIDECTTFTVNYLREIGDSLGAVRTTNSTVMFRLELKHLGQASYRYTANTSGPGDAIR